MTAGKLGLTQEEAAEKLQVNLTHYGNIERAVCNPSLPLFLRIAKELNLSVDAYLYSTRDDTAAEITRLLSKLFQARMSDYLRKYPYPS